MMQKAYATFASVSQVDEKGEAIRARWADLVNEAAKKHGEYINDFVQGRFYSGVEKDPRDSREPDEKSDLKGLPGFVQRKPTGLSDDRNVQPVNKKADVFVNKFLEKARAKKEAAKAEASKEEGTKEESSAVERQ